MILCPLRFEGSIVWTPPLSRGTLQFTGIDRRSDRSAVSLGPEFLRAKLRRFSSMDPSSFSQQERIIRQNFGCAWKRFLIDDGQRAFQALFRSSETDGIKRASQISEPRPELPDSLHCSKRDPVCAMSPVAMASHSA